MRLSKAIIENIKSLGVVQPPSGPDPNSDLGKFMLHNRPNQIARQLELEPESRSEIRQFLEKMRPILAKFTAIFEILAQAKFYDENFMSMSLTEGQMLKMTCFEYINYSKFVIRHCHRLVRDHPQAFLKYIEVLNKYMTQKLGQNFEKYILRITSFD